MKKFYTIGLVIIAMIITQQAFTQKENAKSPIRGEQQIELSEGYSFVSSWIMAQNPDMQDILQNNLTYLEFVRNSQGYMLQKIGPNWVNNIGDWVNTEGYLFKMSAADNLLMTGDAISPQTPIALSTGYQIVGYLPDQALNTEEVFQDILENLGFVRNTAGFMFQKIGPVWVNNIGDMQPGEGYLVKMTADDVLIYPGSSSFTCGNPLTDPRDGQTYTTVPIGGQCWMAENLNIGTMINSTEVMTDNATIEKYCYDNDPANCETYGGLYQWNEMMQYVTTEGTQGLCPTGWHLPTDAEWCTLEQEVDPTITCSSEYFRGVDGGGKLKEAGTTHWSSPNLGATNTSGFTALPGGYFSSNGSFYNLTVFTYLWTSSLYGSFVWARCLYYNSAQVGREYCYQTEGFSSRCLHDETAPTNQPPESPSFPFPENGAIDQSIETNISWTCTDPEGDPLTYDIYFGTETTPPQVATGQTETTYDQGTMEHFTQYFWKIVAHDNHGNTTEGPVWSFTTGDNQPPEQPASPSPENGATNQSIEGVLSWTCTDPEGDPMTYDVYFGTVFPPPSVVNSQTETTYDPGNMEALTQYFWKIVAHDYYENTTAGAVWCFATGDCGSPFTDPRNGQTYYNVQIGNQCWMAENLNIGTMLYGSANMTDNGVIEKYCYDNDSANCDEYGGLYQWNEMMQYITDTVTQGICPSGWHLPTDEEYTILIDFLGGSVNNAGGKMKETGTTHWWPPNTGATNESEFTSLPGGQRHPWGSFLHLGTYGTLWSSTQNSSTIAYSRGMTYTNGNVNRGTPSMVTGLSVRCLQGEGVSPPVNNPPDPPSNPSPEIGAENQSLYTDISWTCTDPEGDPLTYDVYFGTGVPTIVSTGQTETTYDPDTLDNYLLYYWKIVAHDDHGNTTEGAYWSFTTEDCGNPFTDPRDGQTYNSVKIGEQCWMAENLNIGEMINGSEEMTDNGVIEKYCFGNEHENCETYGGLYQWFEMMEYTTTQGVQGICPSGWHIPTDDEWKELEGTVDSQYPVGDPIWNQLWWRGYDAGKNLKSATGWYQNTGTDAFGFTALPGGHRDYDGTFHQLTTYNYFWSSSCEYSPLLDIWKRSLNYQYVRVSRNVVSDPDCGFSARCLRDYYTPPVNNPPDPPVSPDPVD